MSSRVISKPAVTRGNPGIRKIEALISPTPYAVLGEPTIAVRMAAKPT